MEGRQKIYNYLGKLNDDDRQQLAGYLIKAGYAVRIGKEQKEGKGKTIYFVEYWKEGADAPN